jgi:hypothetical protein
MKPSGLLKFDAAHYGRWSKCLRLEDGGNKFSETVVPLIAYTMSQPRRQNLNILRIEDRMCYCGYFSIFKLVMLKGKWFLYDELKGKEAWLAEKLKYWTKKCDTRNPEIRRELPVCHPKSTWIAPVPPKIGVNRPCATQNRRELPPCHPKSTWIAPVPPKIDVNCPCATQNRRELPLCHQIPDFNSPDAIRNPTWIAPAPSETRLQ